jgi:hypothetical protein
MRHRLANEPRQMDNVTETKKSWVRGIGRHTNIMPWRR